MSYKHCHPYLFTRELTIKPWTITFVLPEHYAWCRLSHAEVQHRLCDKAQPASSRMMTQSPTYQIFHLWLAEFLSHLTFTFLSVIWIEAILIRAPAYTINPPGIRSRTCRRRCRFTVTWTTAPRSCPYASWNWGMQFELPTITKSVCEQAYDGAWVSTILERGDDSCELLGEPAHGRW